ncbi:MULTISPECIES: transglycosylase domain-containing protein [unclassified Exiguobacterium]|uniref:transglycosylase domain-containing protein n=1 Tax=unclassified Exiguobacterium TaxID=2644629 RepID=UPI00103FEC01|nr:MULTISPECIES: transglycosylase domain-containing protein [unclassified Exiguobacterium]TCI47828.1 penicillin-binding protein [Exiguobacterium sp. SH5S32]TCI54712.1 penicillin-binding protein [Exiguobacterium sp. SH1S4]TCI74508.1 penicillin-binding protein [Exiguobacterium sp. SH1S1]
MLQKIRDIWNTPKSLKARRYANVFYDVSWNVLLLTIISVVLIGFLGAGIGAGYFASLVKDMPTPAYKTMTSQINTYSSTSEIYFGSGERIGNYTTDEVRVPITVDKVSPFVVDALLATEDVEFYEHDGVVPKATLRAILQEATGSEERTGGSTLTQQLIKNQMLTNEVSFERKAKEILLALRLEKAMDKDEILNAYLNVVSFGRNSMGRNISGIEAASRGVFNTSAEKLTLPQAAFLAGIPKNPFLYTPYYQGGVIKEDVSPAINRMKTVLNRMYVAGKITKEDYDAAYNYDITQDFMKTQSKPRDRYPYVVQWAEEDALLIVRDHLLKEDGVDLNDLSSDDREEILSTYGRRAHNALRQGGYKIHLSLDKKVHESMQQPARNVNNFGPRNPDKNVDPEQGPEQTAAIMLDNKTGRILGFVGGRYVNGKADDFNRARLMKRQIGSTAKPLLVYANAIEQGLITTDTVIIDEEYKYQNGSNPNTIPVRNEDRGYRGAMTARDALKLSRNVPAVKIYEERAAFRKDTEKLIQMGINVPEDVRVAPSMALGVSSVSLASLASGYAMLANGGEHVEPYIIDRVEYQDEVIYENNPKKTQVYSDRTAYLIVDMLRDVYTSGTATYAKSLLNVPGDWMGKTGTTQDIRDSYLVGSTPGVTLAVWTGYDKEYPLSDGGGYGRYYQRTQGMWSKIANNVYLDRPEVFNSNARFVQPASVKPDDFKDSGTFSEKKKLEEKKKEEEAKKKAEEAKQKAEEAKEEAEQAEQDADAKRDADAKANAEAEAKQKAEAAKKAEEEAKKKADAAKKAEAEAKKKAEDEAKAKEEAEKEADAS